MQKYLTSLTPLMPGEINDQLIRISAVIVLNELEFQRLLYVL